MILFLTRPVHYMLQLETLIAIFHTIVSLLHITKSTHLYIHFSFVEPIIPTLILKLKLLPSQTQLSHSFFYLPFQPPLSSPSPLVFFFRIKKKKIVPYAGTPLDAYLYDSTIFLVQIHDFEYLLFSSLSLSFFTSIYGLLKKRERERNRKKKKKTDRR